MAAYPGISALTVDAPPASLAHHMRLSRVLPSDDWHALRTAAYHRSGYRCARAQGCVLKTSDKSHVRGMHAGYAEARGSGIKT